MMSEIVDKVDRMEFSYHMGGLDASIGDMLVADLHSKHVAVPNDRNREVICLAGESSRRMGWDDTVFWGAHRGGTPESEAGIIYKMLEDGFRRPMRVVIDQYGRLWADNTHTACMWMLRMGRAVKLKHVPCYVVEPYKAGGEWCGGHIYDPHVSVEFSFYVIRNIIAGAARIPVKIEYGFRPRGVDWTIRDLADSMGDVLSLRRAGSGS